MSNLDEAAVLRDINAFLTVMGFTRPGADSDYRRGTDIDLRFKTGMVYGEVTITVWKREKQIDVIRILNDGQVNEAKAKIERLVYPAQIVSGVAE